MPEAAHLNQRVADFSISATHSTQSVKPGKTATYVVTLTPIDGFTGSVVLTCAGAPPKGSCSITPSSVSLNGTANATAKLTLKTAMGKAGTPAGAYTVTLTGAFGTLEHSTTVTVVVQ